MMGGQVVSSFMDEVMETSPPRHCLRNSREMNRSPESSRYIKKSPTKPTTSCYKNQKLDFSQIYLSPRKTNCQSKKDRRKKKKRKPRKNVILYDRFIPSRKESLLQVAYEKGGQDSNDE